VTNDRRKQLQQQYRQQPLEAGVYRIVNQRTGKALLGSSLNLPSMRGKLDFARRTGTPSALDHRLWNDVRKDGIDAFAFEILEVLEITPEMTQTRINEDLAALEALWRERLADQSLY
jgi:hypothetical protein